MSNLKQLQENLDYHFQDESLLQLALTHPSVAHDLKLSSGDNQRLEFLGDAVLQMTLTVYLFRTRTRAPEGQLTQTRAAAVNRKALASLARTLKVGDHLHLSRGEENNKGRKKASNLADAMEAIIGALFLDGGYEASSAWVEKWFPPILEQIEAGDQSFNPKGQLQEILQGEGKTTPVYLLENESGPDHNKSYTVVARTEHGEIGRGTGSSKKEAESAAARDALDKLKPSRIQRSPD